MNSKTLIASVLGAVGLFVSGYVLYMYVMPSIMTTPSMTSDPNLMYIILGELVFGYLIATTLSASGTTDLVGAAKAAALLGFIIALASGLVDVGTSDVDIKAAVVDAVVWGVRWGLGGAAAAWWLARD